MAERDLLNRAEDYQRRYHVQEVEQASDKETYLYYSTQRPIDIDTYPNSYFNRPVHMDLYFTRQQVPGEAFQAWGAITYAHPLTEREMQDYELRPAHDNPEGREPVPERGAAKKPPIAEQMKEAGRKAREQRAPDAPEKKSPSRDDR